jgi:hypothetical protein
MARFIEVLYPHHLEASVLANSAAPISGEPLHADDEVNTLSSVAVAALLALALLILFGEGIQTFVQQHWVGYLGGQACLGP